MVQLEELRASKLFCDLADRELAGLASSATRREFAAGTCIYREDEPGGALYVLLRGRVRVAKRIRFDESHVLHHLGAGDFFGEISFTSGLKHCATADAVAGTTVIEIRREAFDELAAREPAIALRIMTRIAFQLGMLVRNMDEQFIDAISYIWYRGKR